MKHSTPKLTFIYPKTWWQLPFAFAVASHKFSAKCRLCGIHPCQILSVQQIPHKTNPHWFNRQRFLCDGCHQGIVWQKSYFDLDLTTAATLPYAQQNSFGLSQSSTSHTPISPTTIQGVASTFYTYPFDSVIRAFKNQHHLYQLPILLHALRQLDLPAGCHPDNSLILPMPTTLKRLTARGFDPVTLLVSYLSFHWQMPIFSHIARAERQTQQGLSKAERISNVENAFYFTQPIPTTIKHLIVFDDVATTGATLQSLCQTILDEFSHANFTLHARALVHGKFS